jgi:hypothetical protein
MPFETGSQSLDTLSNELLRRLIEVQRQDAGDKALKRPIREIAFHDFAAYRLLLKPSLITFIGDEMTGTSSSQPVDLDAWIEFDWFVSWFPQEIQVTIRDVVFGEVSLVMYTGYGDAINPNDPQVMHDIENHLHPMVADFAEVFRETMGLVLFELFRIAADKYAFTEKAREAVRNWLHGQLMSMVDGDHTIQYENFIKLQSAAFWLGGTPQVVSAIGNFQREAPPGGPEPTSFGEKLPPNYPFTPFTPDTVNFGFMMIYRQTWTPLGTQPGEVVRTLPLGPRQAEKIGIKLVNTTRSSRSSESTRSLETSTEASATSKDSSEIVDEASSKFHWDVNADASGPIEMVEVGVSAGMGGELASSSRETKSRLNETMKKTASRLRSDTKIVVTLEREQQDERSQYSEIVNPNDEIAVTYVYSRLQRQYEIETHLATVDAVVYVAERVPAPKEVTGDWIRRHDWIIARALLDESFRDDLDVVRNHEYSSPVVEPIDANIQRLMQTISGTADATPGGIPDYSGVGGTIPDLFQNMQQAYEREVERQRARTAESERYRRAVRRLRAHLYDNILHYCHAIWSAEDPNARYLRYRAIRVPIRWEFIGTGAPIGHTIEGQFAPAIANQQTDTAMLVDLIDLAGPVGYCGNYAVYRLRVSDAWPSLTSMIDLARLPFLRITVAVRHEDKKRADLFDCFGAASASRQEERRYRLIYTEDDVPFFLLQSEQAARVFTDVDKLPYTEGRYLQFEALRIWITPRTDGQGAVARLQTGDTFSVSVRMLPVLEDPERRLITWSTGPLPEVDEEAFFTPETIEKFGEFFADCAEVLKKVGKLQPGWKDLDPAAQAVLLGRYFDYLLKIRHTQRILVDSNDLILTREVDTTSSLEPFKALHRYIDALSAFEDMTAKQLENRRVSARLQANLLGDPNVDRVTIVSGDADAPIVTAIDGGGPDDGDDG